ncbi:hypothetical protein BC831DRAFT_548468 [Entophlyctis helioformis]|nr:hypothetical protein BC831DRAFT_548468 [Entophlyctis helioformis]
MIVSRRGSAGGRTQPQPWWAEHEREAVIKAQESLRALEARESQAAVSSTLEQSRLEIQCRSLLLRLDCIDLASDWLSRLQQTGQAVTEHETAAFESRMAALQARLGAPMPDTGAEQLVALFDEAAGAESPASAVVAAVSGQNEYRRHQDLVAQIQEMQAKVHKAELELDNVNSYLDEMFLMSSDLLKP